MDSISQAVLGATVQVALLGKVQKKKAVLYGAMLGTLPDLDVFLFGFQNQILSMTWHRSFSHSIFVLTALAALITWLVRKYRPNGAYTSQRLFLAVWLALVTHPILDSLTVYGTQLFWPFHFTPLAITGVYIADPIYTLPMLFLCLHVLFKGMGKSVATWAWIAFFWGWLYIGMGVGTRLNMESKARAEIEATGAKVVDTMGTPTIPFTNLLWRVLVKTDDGHYYEVYKSPFDKGPGERIRLNLHNELLPIVKDDPDYKRLEWFTGGWTRLDIVENKLIVSDLRMGTVRELMFRFELYMEDGKNQWVKLVPRNKKRLVRTSRLIEDIGKLLSREFNYDKKLPLESWLNEKQYPEKPYENFPTKTVRIEFK